MHRFNYWLYVLSVVDPFLIICINVKLFHNLCLSI
uniref:Uncharacterized protein n=1 Tax=Amphimedon queenslandica TaxID=400682 RepID=A0A1X7UV45_AMPQE